MFWLRKILYAYCSLLIRICCNYFFYHLLQTNSFKTHCSCAKIGLWAVVTQRFISKSLKYVSRHFFNKQLNYETHKILCFLFVCKIFLIRCYKIVHCFSKTFQNNSEEKMLQFLNVLNFPHDKVFSRYFDLFKSKVFTKLWVSIKENSSRHLVKKIFSKNFW